MCFAIWAGPKRRFWQDAKVVKIGRSVVEAEEMEYTPSPYSAAGAVGAGVTTRHTKIWTYAFKTEQQLYVGKVEKKPVEGVREGDLIRVAVYRGMLYLLTPNGKEHKLELLNSK